MMRCIVDKETERRLAEAALCSMSRGDSLLWPYLFTASQVSLMIEGRCDARAHDVTCCAMPLFQRLKEAL